MSIMGNAFFHSPVLHGVGHHGCHVRIKPAAFIDGLLEGLVGILGQALLHDGIVENVAAEKLVHLGHTGSSSTINQMGLQPSCAGCAHMTKGYRENYAHSTLAVWGEYSRGGLVCQAFFATFFRIPSKMALICRKNTIEYK